MPPRRSGTAAVIEGHTLPQQAEIKSCFKSLVLRCGKYANSRGDRGASPPHQCGAQAAAGCDFPGSIRHPMTYPEKVRNLSRLVYTPRAVRRFPRLFER